MHSVVEIRQKQHSNLKSLILGLVGQMHPNCPSQSPTCSTAPRGCDAAASHKRTNNDRKEWWGTKRFSALHHTAQACAQHQQTLLSEATIQWTKPMNNKEPTQAGTRKQHFILFVSRVTWLSVSKQCCRPRGAARLGPAAAMAALEWSSGLS